MQQPITLSPYKRFLLAQLDFNFFSFSPQQQTIIKKHNEAETHF